ncbi:MAG: rhodanese-like domain-containing protein [Pleurocapsa sp.]
MFYSIPEIDVQELAVYLANKDSNVLLIDVREPAEVAIACIDGFEIFPLSKFAQWSETLLNRMQSETEAIVMCHHGMRSAQLCQWLMTKGINNVKNVMGGIDAYSRFIDSTVTRY